jgi:hypothetical protein
MLAVTDVDHALISREVEACGLRESWTACQPPTA